MRAAPRSSRWVNSLIPYPARRSSIITVTASPADKCDVSSGTSIRQLALARPASRCDPGPPTVLTT